ncbi:diacylglycerol kinase family protein [Arthrobacter sp.]|uniref:diacylglycerol/lipid kinase family protein n=1 Tax=Arthrobacter sp. TaxID=1667 RepID=UPI00281139F3|nr:diacylglycerol kinase family protein [Arthrobacter sp.]
MRLVLAVNPTAGSGAGARAMPGTLAGLEASGHTLRVVGLQGLSSLQAELETALAGDPDGLIAIGGDGLVHVAINALAGTSVPLGIIPAGTGNDIARSLGVPLGSPSAALAVIMKSLTGDPRLIDLGRIRGTDRPDVWFAAACSAGLDAVVNARANRWSWPRGRARYVLALFRELPFFRPPQYRLSADGHRTDPHAVLVCIANMRSIGGGMLIAPDARPDDGQLDLLVIDPLPRLRLLMLFPLLFSGGHVRLRAVHIRRVSSVELEVRDVELFADGEPVGDGPVQIDVVPRALRVLAP